MLILISKNFNDLSDEIKIRIINDSIRHIKKNYYNPRSKKVENLIYKLKQKNFTKYYFRWLFIFKKMTKFGLKKRKKVIFNLFLIYFVLFTTNLKLKYTC